MIGEMIKRSSPLEMFLGKGVLKICSKCTGKHPCRIVISIKLLCEIFKIQRDSKQNGFRYFTVSYRNQPSDLHCK